VLRAAVAEFSTRAIAGTINVVLRKPASKPSRELRTSWAGGGSKTASNLSGAMSGQHDALAYSLNANLTHVKSSQPDSTVIRSPQSGRREQGIVHSAAWIANASSRLTWSGAEGEKLDWQTMLTLNDLRSDSAMQAEALYGPGSPLARLLTWRSSRFATLRTELGWSTRLAGSATLATSVSAAASRFLRRLPRRSYAQDGAPIIDRGNDSEPLGIGVNWKGKYNRPLGGGHSFSAGWDGGFGVQRDHEVQHDRGMLSFDRAYHSRVTNLAAYLQDEWEVSKELSLYAGLRHEAGLTHSSGSDFAPASSREAVSSPLLQALYKLPGNDKSQLRAAMTRTYKSPAPSQLVPRLGSSHENSEVQPDYSGNPLLRPEIARGIDLAWEYYWREGALLSLSAGTRQIDDVIGDATGFENGRWVSRPRNLGNARSRSLEGELKFPWKHWKLAFSIGRHHSHVDSLPGPGNRLASQSPWTANALADYSSGAWAAGASYAFSTAGWSRLTQEQWSYGGVKRALEAYISYKPDAASKLRLTLLNLARPVEFQGTRYDQTESIMRVPSRARVRINYELRFQ
jgi:outer membrane receptor protein involved in Fe transport